MTRNANASHGGLALWITYINIVLYALCYQLQRPVEPYLVKHLSEFSEDTNSVAHNYGRLNSLFSAIQTVGSPLVGILLDRVGIRLASAAVFFASAVSYAILANASDMRWLYFSKIPTALQHAFLVAQATAATSTRGDDSARAQALGRMTTAYTLGATLGPALGGYLADRGDLYIGATLAALGSLVSVVLSFFLPSASQQNFKSKESVSLKKKRSFGEELKHSGEMVLRSALWPFLLVKVLSGVSSSMHSTALPIVLTQKLEFDPSEFGFSMSTSMFAVAAFGAVALAPLTRTLGTAGMAHSGLVLRIALGLAMATTVQSIMMSRANGGSILQRYTVIAISVCHGLASHALATGLTTQTTGAVAAQEQGALLGLEHSLFSLARIGGPPLGTSLLDGSGGFWAVEIACALVDLALVAILIVTTGKSSISSKTGTSIEKDKKS